MSYQASKQFRRLISFLDQLHFYPFYIGGLFLLMLDELLTSDIMQYITPLIEPLASALVPTAVFLVHDIAGFPMSVFDTVGITVVSGPITLGATMIVVVLVTSLSMVVTVTAISAILFAMSCIGKSVWVIAGVCSSVTKRVKR